VNASKEAVEENMAKNNDEPCSRCNSLVQNQRELKNSTAKLQAGKG